MIKTQKRKKFIKTYCTYRGRVYCRYFVFISIFRSILILFITISMFHLIGTYFNRVECRFRFIYNSSVGAPNCILFVEKKHTHRAFVSVPFLLVFLFISIHCDLFAKFCLFGHYFFSNSTSILRRPVVPTHIEFRATRFRYTGIDRYGNKLFGGIASAQR